LGRPVVFREGIELHDVEFDGTQFIAVGVSGTYVATEDEGLSLGARSLVVRSTDGTNWSRVFESASGPILDVVSAHDPFVAVGRGLWVTSTGERTDTAVLLTSDDRETWSLRQTPTEDGLVAVIGGESGFIALSDQSVWHTPSGVTFTEHTVPQAPGERLRGLVRSRGITLTYSNAQLFRSLDDGITWQELPPFNASESIPDGPGVFWATPEGFAGTTSFLSRTFSDVTSSDGLSWIRTERLGEERSVRVRQILKGPSATLRLTTAFEAHVQLQTEDGAWVPTLAQGNALAYGKDVFVAAGVGGIHTSVDGATWVPSAITLD
jgi:hypothetical protein